ncbi:hypothetical protein BSL78_29180 [Apostichopus japonicus]|uniref:ZSWIM1/3 RNaseH-like domain-containing protein n=1 Tax=Stichopus japonicus TaxID=307972 RepID=A0A2G8JE59_STIJA|nr:hypothetical protein BSL78_29180 [Apostichopus japonicus]
MIVTELIESNDFVECPSQRMATSIFSNETMGDVLADDKNSKRKKAARNRILWKIEDIDDNIPLQVTSREILNCQYGKPPKPTKNPTVKISDHNYGQPSRKRFHVQKSRKVGCPSKVYIRHITRYNAFKLSQTAGQREKQKTMEKLHQSIRSKEADTNPEQIIHVKLPLHQSHKNHKVSIESGFSKPIDAAVRDKIHEYVSLGITSVPLIKRVLKTFVESELCPANQVKPTSNDRAYFPSCHSIQNHVHHALVAGRFSGLDQENLENKVADWKAKEKSSNFFLRKCTSEESMNKRQNLSESTILTERCFPLTDENDLDDNSDEPYVRKNTFLFIHQTVQQKMLLERYGELVLLDATYRTTKYALPLFLMVVRTNVGYTPVATFICESETTAHIAEALSIIKEWNLQVETSIFMMTILKQEYQALQDVFPEAHKKFSQILPKRLIKKLVLEPVQQEDETDISVKKPVPAIGIFHSTQKCLREKLKVLQDLFFSPLMLMSCQMSSPNSHWHVLNWNRPYREKASCLYTSLARNQPFVHCLKERKR